MESLAACREHEKPDLKMYFTVNLAFVDYLEESNFLLESLAACREHEKPDLKMYFTVNLAFVDYLEELNETIKTPINRN